MTLSVQPPLFQSLCLLGLALLIFGAASFSLPWAWVVLCVIAPLCEEVIFRWGLQEGLFQRRWSPWQANLATALVFVVAHGVFRSWALAAWVAVPALFLGWVYQRGRARGAGGAVWQCVLWHSGFNVIYLMLHHRYAF